MKVYLRNVHLQSLTVMYVLMLESSKVTLTFHAFGVEFLVLIFFSYLSSFLMAFSFVGLNIGLCSVFGEVTITEE